MDNRVSTFTFIFCAFLCLSLYGQTDLKISPYVRMPKDSILKKELIIGLNEFIQHPHSDNKRINPTNKIATLCFMDELVDIENGKDKKGFFKPYLNNVIQIDNSTFLAQISYIGIDDITAHERIHFDIIGHVNENNEFTFSSPMAETMNSHDWKTKSIGSLTLFYKNELNESLLQDFYDKKIKIDQQFKFKKEVSQERIYCVSNAIEALKLLGVNSKLDYNGRKNLTLRYTHDNTTLTITSYSFEDGFGVFDPHDYFHAQAAKAVTGDMYNHYMACAGGYVYGGSWGITWNEIKTIFKAKMLDGTKKDWLKLYIARYNFGESQEKHLLMTQFINALIIEKTLEEKGFSAVKELLNSGNFRRDQKQFFKELERITGINEKNFNKKAEKLIRNMG